MKLDNLKNFNWRSLSKLTNPQSLNDMNHFMEGLPNHTSKLLLIIAGVTWAFGALLGLYTTVKMQELADISVQKNEEEATLPTVPKISNTSVKPDDIKKFVDELKKIYKGLEIKGNSSNIILSAKSTSEFGQFREAIGHIQNGGFGWRVNIDKICVGKECQQTPLAATLKINRVSVEK